MTNIEEMKLDFYINVLEEELGAVEVRHISVCMYADALARIYDSLNKSGEASKYFSMAAEACLTDLHHGLGATKTLPKSRGDDRLGCARLLWRAGDDRVIEYIQQAFDAYRDGYDSGPDTDQAHCWSRSAYCLIFLEEFKAAIAAISRSLDLKRKMDHPVIDDPSEIIIEIIECIEEANQADSVSAISSLETFLRKHSISVYGMNSPEIVDVYLFLKQKVDAME